MNQFLERASLSEANLAAVAARARRCRNFGGLASSGRPLRFRQRRDIPLVTDFASMCVHRLPLPVVLDHGGADWIVGAVQRLSASDGMLYFVGVVFDSTLIGAEIFDAAVAGTRWHCSISTSATDQRAICPGEIVTVNGRTWRGPLLCEVHATLVEISLSTSPADCDTFTKIEGRDCPLPDLTEIARFTPVGPAPALILPSAASAPVALDTLSATANSASHRMGSANESRVAIPDDLRLL
jgi:hypothetical protein